MAFLDREGLQKVWAHMNSQIYKKAEKNKEELTSYITEELGYYSNYVTPQMFGAKGDGVTDDTVAMQAAFDDVANNGKYLFIPKGRYKVTSPITVDWSRDSATKRNFLQKIVGAGSQAFEKYYDNSVIVGYNIPANRGVIELMGDGNTWGPQTRIEDLGIECDESTCDPMSFALKYGDARNFLLHRVKLKGHNTILARCGSIVDESGNSVTHGYEQINVKFVQCDFHVYESNTKGFAFLPEGVITGQHATMDNIVVDSCWSSGVWVVTSVNIMFQNCQVCIPNVANKEITTDNVGKLNGYEVDYATGFYVGQAMSAVFQNCYFEDHRRSFHITPTLGSVRNVSIMNCYLNPGCNQFNADGSRLCADYGVLITPGTSSGVVRNVLVQNNVFRLVDGDTEFVVASVRNECAEHFVFRDNCTTSTLAVTKVENTTTSGYDIQNGKDSGASVKSMITSADGKTLTIELTNGKSMTFNTGASAPTKGVDYFTEAEIEDITDNAAALAKADLQQIAPPTWVKSVDDMTDTNKHYVLQESGNIWAYMKKTKTIPGGTAANFTNRIKDANAYVKNGYRYSHSSAAFKEQASDAAIVVPIPSASTYTFRTRGATYAGCTYPASVYFGTTNEAFSGAPINNAGEGVSYGTDNNGDTFVTIYKPPTGTWNYAVFHVAKVTNVDALIVTVNEEITYTNTEASTETVSEWTDTGSYLGDTFATRQQFKPEFANNIEECTDQSKLYVLPDGYIYASIAHATEGGKTPLFSNLLENSSCEIKHDVRYSHSSAAFVSASNQACDSVIIPIPTSGNVTLRFKGLGYHYYNGGTVSYTNVYTGKDKVTFGTNTGITGANAWLTDDPTCDYYFTFSNSAGNSYLVFMTNKPIADGAIVTANQPIEYETVADGVSYVWESTGHAFVPADYEERIIASEEAIDDLGGRVSALESGQTDSAMSAMPTMVYAPSPQLPADGSETADFDADNIGASDIYAYIDALVTKYPQYLTKETLGKDESGEYDWNRYTASRRTYDAWVKPTHPAMYAWVSGSTVIYSVSVSPRVGDTMYTTAYIGTAYSTVTAVDTPNQTRTVNGLVFSRDKSKDVSPTLVYTQADYNPYRLGVYATWHNKVYNTSRTSIGTIASIADGVLTDSNANTYTRYPMGDVDSNFKHLPVLVVGSNEHGGNGEGDPAEPAIISARLIKDLCECRNADNPFLNMLKSEYMIVFCPLINPWGYGKDNGYTNVNSVNLDRNFDTPGWGGDSDTRHGDYGGSENETQYFMNTLYASGAKIALANHALGDRLNTETGEAVSAGMCSYMVGRDQTKYTAPLASIAETMNVNYGLSFYNMGQAPAESYGKTRSYMDYIGIEGGAVEMTAIEGYLLHGGARHTAQALEADYTLLLQFLNMLIECKDL